jgi:hypothetical protein
MREDESHGKTIRVSAPQKKHMFYRQKLLSAALHGFGDVFSGIVKKEGLGAVGSGP